MAKSSTVSGKEVPLALARLAGQHDIVDHSPVADELANLNSLPASRLGATRTNRQSNRAAQARPPDSCRFVGMFDIVDLPLKVAYECPSVMQSVCFKRGSHANQSEPTDPEQLQLV